MNISYIELRGDQHPLCYNLYAIEQICEEFGGLDKMQEAMDGGNQAVAVGKVLKILLASGRAYCEEMGIDLPKAVKNPSALIDITAPETVKAVFSAITSGKKTDVEVQTKNAEPTP